MTSSKPILISDTSGLNRLVDDSDSAILIAACKAGYFVRLTGDNFREIAANQKTARRQKLLSLFKQLLTEGECALSYNWILEGHIRAFQRDPRRYDWRLHSVRFPHAEKEIVHQEFLNDKVAAQELEDAQQMEAVFEEMFSHARPEFQRLFESGAERRPANVREFVEVLQIPGGMFWGYGIALYAKVSGITVDEATIRGFIGRCPPFKAVILAICTAQYDRCIRPANQGPSLRAGRLDMYSAVHLPYCDKFVTADGCQLNALREVAALGAFSAEVVSYEEFRSAMFLPVYQ